MRDRIDNIGLTDPHDTGNSDGYKTYEILPDVSIELFINNQVWLPYSAPAILHTLDKNNMLSLFPGSKVLDMGSGTGILGITSSMLGAKYVMMADNSKAATDLSDVNARLSGLKKKFDYDVVRTDVFSNIPEGVKFDIIIGNLPMNPSLKNVTVDNAAYRSNQNKDELGRAVLDEVISKAKKYLNPGGNLIITSSSRQNYQLTKHMLEKHFGQQDEGWRVLNSNRSSTIHLPGIHQSLDGNPEYYGPFIEHWTNKSFIHHSLMIYNLDENGNPVYQIDMPNKKMRMSVANLNGNLERVIYSRNGDGITKAYILGNDMPEYDPNIDTSSIDLEAEQSTSHELFHNYMIIHAVNN